MLCVAEIFRNEDSSLLDFSSDDEQGDPTFLLKDYYERANEIVGSASTSNTNLIRELPSDYSSCKFTL